ncbi:HNH endonuclease [Microbacterium phage Rasputia]|nr:HNH endonuclease [Microbacterium phage Rasputia]
MNCPECGWEPTVPGKRALGIHFARKHPAKKVELSVAMYTDQRGPDECWPWTGRVSDKGYAVLKLTGGKIQRISRFLLGLKLGDRRVARHTCDNPVCVNPAHIVEGTSKQNTQDMEERGRQKGRFETGNYPARWKKVTA